MPSGSESWWSRACSFAGQPAIGVKLREPRIEAHGGVLARHGYAFGDQQADDRPVALGFYDAIPPAVAHARHLDGNAAGRETHELRPHADLEFLRGRRRI